jgi:DNA replication licensing factor MCM3
MSGFSDRIVSMQFMRKYIHVAKNISPTLTQPASELIAEEYAKLRSQDNLAQDNNMARVSCPCIRCDFQHCG